jgi:hypothetical protein
MGVMAVKWHCPACDIDVGGSLGELKNHNKKVHAVRTAKPEARVATAA